MTTITFQELQRLLYDQPKIMAKKLTLEGEKLGHETEDFAKINARTFPRVWTGRLRASIKPQRLPHGQFGFLLRAGGQNIVGHAGIPADVEYAAKIEFGEGKLKPRLFMARAMQKTEKTLPDKLAKIVRMSLGDRSI